MTDEDDDSNKIESIDDYKSKPSKPAKGSSQWKQNVSNGIKKAGKRGGASESAIKARQVGAALKRLKLKSYERMRTSLLEKYPNLDSLDEEEVRILMEHYLKLGLGDE